MRKMLSPLCLLFLLEGCAFITPTTELSGPGWHFVDTKDNDIEFVGNFESGKFIIEKLTISNKSSPVIEANVQQMLALVEQQKAANEGIKTVTELLLKAITVATPNSVPN